MKVQQFKEFEKKILNDKTKVLYTFKLQYDDIKAKEKQFF